MLELTLSWRTPLSYRNQSIDLLWKSMDWFLYDNGPRHERVNKPWKTELIEGRCTRCNTKRCEQQQTRTLICIVLSPNLHAFFSSNGLCEVLLLPRSSHNGVLLTLTRPSLASWLLWIYLHGDNNWTESQDLIYNQGKTVTDWPLTSTNLKIAKNYPIYG